MNQINLQKIRRILALLLILASTFTLVACKNQQVDTSALINISGKNNEIVNVHVGDIVKLVLVGVNGEGYQWLAQPPTNEIIELIDHITINNVPTNKGEEFKSIWQFKIKKTGQTELKFDYNTPIFGDEPKDTFQVTIVSTEN